MQLLMHVDYKMVLETASLYRLQEIYQDPGKQLVQSMMLTNAQAENEKERQIINMCFISFFELLVNVEGTLLEAYDEILNNKEP